MKQSNINLSKGVEHGTAERLDAATDVHSAYIGLDVHKDSISVSVAEAGRQRPQFRGEIPNESRAIEKLIRQLSERFDGQPLLFSYEAGPCGYGLYHQVRATGHDCEVVAPALIPRKSGDRVKTDRRDAQMLASLSRSGELTPVWVPEPEQEAIRDLTRAREDMKAIELKARQRLGAFLLRHGKRYEGKSRWTQAHWHWLERVKFGSPIQQIVMEECIDAVKQAQQHVAGLEQQMEQALASWSLQPVVTALMAMRGVGLISAMTILAELGDISRFDSPRQLMAYLGLVPSEHSSGGTRRQGGSQKPVTAMFDACWWKRPGAIVLRHVKRKSFSDVLNRHH